MALVNVILVVACQLPSLPTLNGYDVTVRNDTAGELRLYLEAPGVPPGSAVAAGVPLAPGQSFSDHWLVPSGSNDDRRAIVKGKTPDGTLIFCHGFQWRELKAAAFVILLKATNDCN